MNKNVDFKIRIIGIGGQGVSTISAVVARAAAAAELNVTALTRLRSAMRLGPVLSDIRITNKKGFFPSISPGTADAIIGLEPYEGGTSATQLIRSDGYILINTPQTPSIQTIVTGDKYPDMEPIWEKLREVGANLIFLDGCKIARTETGTPQGANFVLLGVLSKRVPEFPISSSILKRIIGENEINLKCFELGYQYQGD